MATKPFWLVTPWYISDPSHSRFTRLPSGKYLLPYHQTTASSKQWDSWIHSQQHSTINKYFVCSIKRLQLAFLCTILCWSVSKTLCFHNNHTQKWPFSLQHSRIVCVQERDVWMPFSTFRANKADWIELNGGQVCVTEMTKEAEMMRAECRLVLPSHRQQAAEALSQTRDTPDNPTTFNTFPLNIKLLHFCAFDFSGC